jgi:glutathione S-transferase
VTLALYGHPFSSYTQKALIALWEKGLAFEFKSLEDSAHGAEWMRRWPMAKMPLLVDGDKQLVETSIIIEYLEITRKSAHALIPADPLAALDVRFLDRFFDLHVMDAMQVAVDAKLGKLPMKSDDGLDLAKARLHRAYGWLEDHLEGKTWAAGETFTLADCAAAPSLFYADWTYEIPAEFPNLRAYRARLLKRPSVARAVDGGRPFRHYFPLGAPDRD